jgi:Ribonuclease G/E
LERLAAAYPDAPVSADDPAVVAELRPVIGPRLGIAIPAWDEALEAAVDALAEPEVMLDEAVRASIHPTPALVAIDIDAGAAVRARGEKTSRHVTLNRRILPALAAQIRLRNLSGAILVDFAGLSPRRRAELGPALADALAADPLHPRLLGFTGLGLAEIVRSRVHPPLHELLKGPHAAGLRALRAIASQAAHEPARALVLHAAPAVVRALEADTRALADLRRLAGRPLTLRSDPGLAPEGWFST